MQILTCMHTLSRPLPPLPLHFCSDFVFSMPTDGTIIDNVTVGERLGIPWPSDNAEHFEARNHACYCTATGGPYPLCYGNRSESLFVNSDTLKE
jgi:hypothetical protein